MSYVRTPVKRPSIHKTIPDMLDQWAKLRPHAEAYVFRAPATKAAEKGDSKYGKSQVGPSSEREGEPQMDPGRVAITFEELQAGSRRVASGLLRLGLKPGDRVATMGRFCPEWVCLDYGALMARILLIRLTSETLTRDTLRALLRRHNCRALIVPTDETILKFGLDFDEKKKESIVEFCQVISLVGTTSSDLPNVTEMMRGSGPDQMKIAEILRLQTAIDPEDPATVFLSSGSTGVPKAIIMSHFSIVNMLNGRLNASGDQTRYFTDRTPTWVGSVPHLAAVTGATMVVVDPDRTVMSPDVSFIFRVFREENVTHGLALSYLMKTLVDGVEHQGFVLPPSLVSLLVAGERLSVQLMRLALKYIPSVTMLYAATELNAAMEAELDVNRDDDNFFRFQSREGCEVKVVDEKGKCVDPGEAGDLLIRSPYAFLGYLDDPELTSASVDSDGWFKTMDCAKVVDGRVEILGRSCDVISRGTRKVYPVTIERILAKHPKVDQIAVVGVPDVRMYEEIFAYIIPVSGSTFEDGELKQFCDDAVLVSASYGFTPKYFQVTAAFPTVNGKLNRCLLREEAARSLGLNTSR